MTRSSRRCAWGSVWEKVPKSTWKRRASAMPGKRRLRLLRLPPPPPQPPPAVVRTRCMGLGVRCHLVQEGVIGSQGLPVLGVGIVCTLVDLTSWPGVHKRQAKCGSSCAANMCGEAGRAFCLPCAYGDRIAALTARRGRSPTLRAIARRSGEDRRLW